jgi:Ser/Thr protein kinase RdoA (MazF antagonist)
MNRAAWMEQVTEHILGPAAALYGAPQGALMPYAETLGCQNLVFDYTLGEQPMILRISYRPDRPLEQIQAEVDFINYLADHGVRVSRAVPSRQGNLVERLEREGQPFHIVAFIKGKGMRVPDNQYRYRPGASIDEYCQNWGQMLGQMHRLAMQFRPVSDSRRRPDWLAVHGHDRVERYISEKLQVIREKFHHLLDVLQTLPTPAGAFGLIHSDFNDGNFTIDYSNGDLTVFDFDDACYGWYIYELACAWEGGVGRTMFEPDASKRKAAMGHYFAQVMAGYEREHTLSEEWMKLLPTFIKVVEMESLVETLAYFADNDLPIPEDEQGRLAYLARCIEDNIPYLGLYHPVFSHQHPFELEGSV